MVIADIRLDVLENLLQLVPADSGAVRNRVADVFLYSA
jgi:hypothetical protein